MFDFSATGQAVAQSETERAEHKRTELTGNPSRAKAPQNELRAKASGVPQLAAVLWQIHEGGNHEGLHTVTREKAFLLFLANMKS